MLLDKMVLPVGGRCKRTKHEVRGESKKVRWSVVGKREAAEHSGGGGGYGMGGRGSGVQNS